MGLSVFLCGSVLLVIRWSSSRKFSDGQRGATESALYGFALNCCVPEAPSEEVLGTVSSAVSAVTHDRNHHFTVFLVVSKNAFETI